MTFKFNSVDEALKDISNGKMIVVLDDKERENEGDLVMAAEKINAGAVNFMLSQARGLLCVGMTGEELDRLQLSAQGAERGCSLMLSSPGSQPRV